MLKTMELPKENIGNKPIDLSLRDIQQGKQKQRYTSVASPLSSSYPIPDPREENKQILKRKKERKKICVNCCVRLIKHFRACFQGTQSS